MNSWELMLGTLAEIVKVWQFSMQYKLILFWTKQSKDKKINKFLGFKVMAAIARLVKYGEIPWPQSTDPKQSWRTRK